MIQNPAGQRATTPTDELLGDIRDALRAAFQPQAPAALDLAPIIISLGSPFYIGTDARFVGLSNGLQLEVKDTLGNWIVQKTWTET